MTHPVVVERGGLTLHQGERIPPGLLVALGRQRQPLWQGRIDRLPLTIAAHELVMNPADDGRVTEEICAALHACAQVQM